MSRPNFFIVGQPKSGTTAFYEFLRQHPEIFMPARKEIHYFCTDFHEENAAWLGRCENFPYRDEQAYLRLFRGWRGEPVVGEASVHYLYSRVAARRIFDFDPSAKILIFLRNPIDFLLSWHAHSLLSNGEVIESFEDALAAEARRKRGELLSPLVKVPSYLYYSDRVRYAEQIARYLEVFPREQVKIVLYDDLVASIDEIYRDLLVFLGVETTFAPEFKVINARKRLRLKHAVRFTKLPHVRSALRTVLPKEFRNRIGLPRLFSALFLAPAPAKPLSSTARHQLTDALIGEVSHLSKLLDQDLLCRWGFERVTSHPGG